MIKQTKHVQHLHLYHNPEQGKELDKQQPDNKDQDDQNKDDKGNKDDNEQDKGEKDPNNKDDQGKEQEKINQKAIKSSEDDNERWGDLPPRLREYINASKNAIPEI